MNRERRHIFFSGRVQGVGFRYQAYYFANQLNLTGWVMNLNDDRVEMEVQGSSNRIDLLIQSLKEARFIHIEDMVSMTLPVILESEFRIRN